tara:strand:- start:518 stop:1459 length:942 start_codon:yes stop_codon:yes gene_type:complete
MSIFKKIGKSLKKAAPLIGAGIGYYFGGPVLGAQFGTALGAGIGTLAGGGDIEDALLAGALGYGAGSLASSAGIGMSQTAAASGATAGTTAATTQGVNTAAQQAAAAEATAPLTHGSSISPEAVKIAGEASASSPGILEGIAGFASENPFTTAALGTGVLGLLASGEPEQEQFDIPETREGRPYETKVRGPITGVIYNLANKDERLEYNNELLQLREESFKYKEGGKVYTGNDNVPETYPNPPGGELKGPGTGTSDSIRVGVYDSKGEYKGPGALSDGEFIMTAKAVDGAGNGDRDIGAARMYDMMSKLESMA